MGSNCPHVPGPGCSGNTGCTRLDVDPFGIIWWKREALPCGNPEPGLKPNFPGQDMVALASPDPRHLEAGIVAGQDSEGPEPGWAVGCGLPFLSRPPCCGREVLTVSSLSFFHRSWGSEGRLVVGHVCCAPCPMGAMWVPAPACLCQHVWMAESSMIQFSARPVGTGFRICRSPTGVPTGEALPTCVLEPSHATSYLVGSAVPQPPFHRTPDTMGLLETPEASSK